eukprot:403364644
MELEDYNPITQPFLETDKGKRFLRLKHQQKQQICSLELDKISQDRDFQQKYGSLQQPFNQRSYKYKEQVQLQHQERRQQLQYKLRNLNHGDASEKLNSSFDQQEDGFAYFIVDDKEKQQLQVINNTGPYMGALKKQVFPSRWNTFKNILYNAASAYTYFDWNLEEALYLLGNKVSETQQINSIELRSNIKRRYSDTNAIDFRNFNLTEKQTPKIDQLSAIQQTFTCAICYDQVPMANLLYLECKHFFCTQCTSSYVSCQKISDEASDLYLKCPQYGCNFKFHTSYMEKYMDPVSFKAARFVEEISAAFVILKHIKVNLVKRKQIKNLRTQCYFMDTTNALIVGPQLSFAMLVARLILVACVTILFVDVVEKIIQAKVTPFSSTYLLASIHSQPISQCLYNFQFYQFLFFSCQQLPCLYLSVVQQQLVLSICFWIEF